MNTLLAAFGFLLAVIAITYLAIGIFGTIVIIGSLGSMSRRYNRNIDDDVDLSRDQLKGLWTWPYFLARNIFRILVIDFISGIRLIFKKQQ